MVQSRRFGGASGRAVRRARAGLRPGLEALEGRQMLAADLALNPMPAGTFVGQMVPGPNGAVWFQKQVKSTTDFSLELTSTLAYIGPDGVVKDYPIPGEVRFGTGPQALAAGPDGSVVALNSTFDGVRFGYKIDRIAADGSLTEVTPSRPILTSPFYKYTLDNSDQSQIKPIYTSLYLTVGGDGSVYVASGTPVSGGVRPFTTLDRIAPDGTVTEFATGRSDGHQLAVAPDGSVWFATTGRGPDGTAYQAELARMAPDGTVSDIFLPGVTAIPSVVAAADGSIWFSETFAAPAASPSVWFPGMRAAPSASPRVGRIAADGTVASFSLNSVGASIGQLTTGSDGKVWFAALTTDSGTASYLVESIDASGTIEQDATIPAADTYVDVDAASITTGPDGQIWFAANSYLSGTSQIGRLVNNPDYTPPVVPPLPIAVTPSDPPTDANPGGPADPPTGVNPGGPMLPIIVDPTDPPTDANPGGPNMVTDPADPPTDANPGGPMLAVDPTDVTPTLTTSEVTPTALRMRARAATRGRSQVVLKLGGDLDPMQARRLANYRVKVPGHPGKVRLASAVYNAKKDTVTLHLRGVLTTGRAYRVTIAAPATQGPAAVARFRAKG